MKANILLFFNFLLLCAATTQALDSGGGVGFGVNNYSKGEVARVNTDQQPTLAQRCLDKGLIPAEHFNITGQAFDLYRKQRARTVIEINDEDLPSELTYALRLYYANAKRSRSTAESLANASNDTIQSNKILALAAITLGASCPLALAFVLMLASSS